MTLKFTPRNTRLSLSLLCRCCSPSPASVEGMSTSEDYKNVAGGSLKLKGGSIKKYSSCPLSFSLCPLTASTSSN